MTDASFISVDWGTTAFRAALADGYGRVLDRRTAQKGIRNVPDGDFAAVLAEAIGDWLRRAGPLPVIASGMIGSRNGWREAPYVPCPAGLADFAAGLLAVEAGLGAPVRIVPGVSRFEADGTPDVMRGEECQIFGALAALGIQDGVLVLPGTHSKWASVGGGRIEGFRTFITGEAYGVLLRHSILGALAEGEEPSEAAFARGLAAARAAGSRGGLLHVAFAARTLALFDRLAGAEVADWLSGLLIGAEFSGAAHAFAADLDRANARIALVGNPALCARYEVAARAFGITAEASPPDAVVLGHLAIARLAHLTDV